jgi:uncharacterized protein (DUF2141 family)
MIDWKTKLTPLRKLAMLTGLVAAMGASPAQAGEGEAEAVVVAEAGTITVTVTGMRNASGSIVVAVWDQSSGFPTKSRKAKRIHIGKISGKKSTVKLAGYEPGTYALSVFHDENNNGELDTNFIGIPKEGVGASNNPKGRMGPPKFKDAAFELGAEDLRHRIKLTYI